MTRSINLALDAAPAAEAGTVYVVLTPATGDLEVLDEMPRWDWLALGQQVRIANVNGGDSAAVEMPAGNRSWGDAACPRR